MNIDTVELGGYYRHQTHGIMRLFAAGWPEHKGDNGFAKLILPEQYDVWPKYSTVWRGTMSEFLASWKKIDPKGDEQ